MKRSIIKVCKTLPVRSVFGFIMWVKRDLYAIKACTTKKIYCTVKKNKKTGNVKKSKSRYMTCANLHRAFITIYRFLSLSLFPCSTLEITDSEREAANFPIYQKNRNFIFFQIDSLRNQKNILWELLLLLWSMAEEMAADEVTAPPRTVLIISAGASHSVALLCTSLSLSLLLRCFFSITDTNGHRDCEIGYEFSWSDI